VADVAETAAGPGIGTVLLGAGIGAAGLAWRATRPLRAVSAGLVHGAVAAVGLAPAPVTAALAQRGRDGRADLERLAEATVRFVVGRVVEAFLGATDLTALVLRHVDLDTIAARLDVDAVVARVDLDAAVRRVDLDAIAARLDPNPVVAAVDFDAAIAKIDLVGIAREVVDAIDLPEIVRHSTGALTSDTVRSVRSGTMNADDAITAFVERLLARRARTPLPP